MSENEIRLSLALLAVLLAVAFIGLAAVSNQLNQARRRITALESTDRTATKPHAATVVVQRSAQPTWPAERVQKIDPSVVNQIIR